jgi:ubiquinone/menaquinone biosynthesis C-methylase UbiE
MITTFRNIISRHPTLVRTLKALKYSVFRYASVSTNYVHLDEARSGLESERLRSAWKSGDLPSRQRRLVDSQIAKFRAGKAVDVYDVFVQALRPLQPQGLVGSLLEVGCSSGFYSEVLDIARLNFVYAGCDYSDAFIAMARERYPGIPFHVQDATKLSFEDDSFDVVVSGCCLLCIPEYAAAVRETARVARQYAIFHRTPVVLGQSNQYYRKFAYGVETFEIHFNEPDFLALLSESGFSLVMNLTLHENARNGTGTATRTYVCRKNRI